MLEDSDGKRFMFEVYSENDGPVKGCKTDSKGTVIQGKHFYDSMIKCPR